MLPSFSQVVFIFAILSNSTSEVITNATHFNLVGNSSHLETLHGILTTDTYDVCTFASINLAYAKVNRRDLINYLRKCKNLKTLSLKYVIWDWDTSSILEKAYLPNLEVFQFELMRDKSSYWKTAEDLESIIIFYKDSLERSGFKQLKNLKFSIDGNTRNGGHLKVENENLEAIKISDTGIWSLLQEIWSGFRSFTAKYSTLGVDRMDMTFMKTVHFDNNELRNGKMADILKTAKVAETLQVHVIDDEALDVALLPSQTITTLITWKLSLRWSSASQPIGFPNLVHLNMTFGDIDLNLFQVSDNVQFLALDHIYLWNSRIQDIGSKMPNLTTLAIGCQFFQGVCPVVELGSLPLNSLTGLVLNNVGLTVERDHIVSFPLLNILMLWRCKMDKEVLIQFNKIFSTVRRLMLTIEDVLKPGFLKKILRNPIEHITVTVPIDTRYYRRLAFANLVKSELNLSLTTASFGGGKGLQFERDGDHWNYEIRNYPLHQLTRITKLLRLFGISTEEITQETLDWMYYAYTSFVYIFCSFGLGCNIMSAIVLMQKSMRSSTSYIMFGLALSDSLFLFTSLVTVEEYQLLFNYEHIRSGFNGYFAYPLNKTAYTGSVYMTVLITVERFVAVCFPFRTSTIFEIRKTIRYIASTLTFAVCLNIPRWFEFIKWSYDASSSSWSSNSPRQLHKFPAYTLIYQKGTWYFFVYAVPLASIGILNVLIWMKAREAADNRRLLASAPKKSMESSLTRILLSIVLVFFICNSVSATVEWVLISKSVEPEVAETFACLPIILNSSVNFILYYLMGTKFRTEFKAVLGQAWNWICYCKSCNLRNVGRGPNGQEITLSRLESAHDSASLNTN